MKISIKPLEAMLVKLKAQTTGLNAQISSKASQYRVAPWSLDFPADIYSGSTTNFFIGQVGLEPISNQGPANPNRACIYAFDTTNQNFEKPSDFSGLIRIGLDFNLEWTASSSGQNFETPSLLLEDAVTEVFQAYTQQNWGVDVIYNGAYSCQRSVVEFSGESNSSLRQLVAFRFVFQLTV